MSGRFKRKLVRRTLPGYQAGRTAHSIPGTGVLEGESRMYVSAAMYAARHSVPEMIEGYLYGWVANQLSAAVRLLPLGPTRAQVLQQRLLPLIADQAVLLQGSDPRKLWSGAVGAGLAQLTHAELYSRLFRS